MTLKTIADIVGASAKVQLSSVTPTRVRRLMLCAHGSSNARFGDVNVGSAQGVELPADTIFQYVPSEADISDTIDLTAAYVYVPSGTTVTVTWGAS